MQGSWGGYKKVGGWSIVGVGVGWGLFFFFFFCSLLGKIGGVTKNL